MAAYPKMMWAIGAYANYCWFEKRLWKAKICSTLTHKPKIMWPEVGQLCCSYESLYGNLELIYGNRWYIIFFYSPILKERSNITQDHRNSMGQYSQHFIDLSFSLDASINNMFKNIYFLNEKQQTTLLICIIDERGYK